MGNLEGKKEGFWHPLRETTCIANTFFSFSLELSSGHGRTAGNEFEKKIPHDVGAQEIFLSNSVAVIDY